jgi:hypothetical protein
VKHSASTIELCSFTLIAGAFSEIIKSLLAGHFQPDGFEGCVHQFSNEKPDPALLRGSLSNGLLSGFSDASSGSLVRRSCI